MLHTDLESLDPQAKEKIQLFLDKLKENDVKYAIIETKRETSVQRAYYAQGRKPLSEVNNLRREAGLWMITDSENMHTVTNCDGINTKSKHQFGRAIDVVPADVTGRPIWNSPKAAWEKMGSIGESCGLVWGGRWKSLPDKPHYEVA